MSEEDHWDDIAKGCFYGLACLVAAFAMFGLRLFYMALIWKWVGVSRLGMPSIGPGGFFALLSIMIIARDKEIPDIKRAEDPTAEARKQLKKVGFRALTYTFAVATCYFIFVL